MFSALFIFAAVGGGPVRIFVDGRPVEPRITYVVGKEGDPQPDDLLDVGFEFPLGSDREQRFVFRGGDRRDELWQEDDARRRWLVGVVVRAERYDAKYRDLPKPRVVNPLASLSVEDRRKVRAVCFEHWDADCARLLEDLDAAKVCLKFLEIDGRKKLPKLPRNLRHLQIEEHSTAAGWTDFSSIEGLPELRSLELSLMSRQADLANIRNLPKLRSLMVHCYGPMTNPSFSGLPELRVASLSGCRGLESVGFAAGTRKLETLRISHTGVADLSPLAGHPALREIDAMESKVAKLPVGPLPAMKSLQLIGAKAFPAAVADFRRANPTCRVDDRWNALFEQLAGADRIRVRSGGTCHRDVASEETLTEERDPAKIREFLAKVRVDETKFGFHCLCCGSPTFEFYRGGKLLAAVGYHHDRSLRWPEGWPSDVMMTTESAAWLVAWLEARVPAIKAGREYAREVAKKEEAEERRFAACFPAALRAALQKADEESIGRAVVAGMPDPVERALACCRSFDVPPGSDRDWYTTVNRERGVVEALKQTPPDAWRKALDRMKADSPEFRGAARLWLVYKANEILPADQRSSYQLRFVAAALERTDDSPKMQLLLTLANFSDPASEAYLMDMICGRKGPMTIQRESGQPGLISGAALCLAQRNVRSAEPEIRRLAGVAKTAADRDALDAALALLGDPKRLSVRQFRSDSHATFMAAVGAVVRFRGAHGLDLLVKEGLQRPKWGREAADAAEKIIGRSFEGEDREEKLLEWWNKEGARFVSGRK